MRKLKWWGEKDFSSVRSAILAVCAASIVVGLSAFFVQSAVTNIAGLAVAQDSPAVRWNNVRDGAAGDNLERGVLATAIYGFDGTNFDRIPGDATNGLTVNFGTAGTAFFAVKRTDIAASSINLAFGFTSKKVAIEFPGTNTDEVCVDWVGGTAVCPAANTSGDDRFSPGSSIVLDQYSATSVSFISSSGTQTISVRAWQ